MIWGICCIILITKTFTSLCISCHVKHINAFDWIPIPLIMSDAIANFYTKASGQKCAGARQMGGAMSQAGKYGIPLWAKIDNKIGELVPSAGSTLDGSNKIGTKINKNVRSLGDKRALENQGEIPATKTMEYVAPKHKAKKKRVRYKLDIPSMMILMMRERYINVIVEMTIHINRG